MAFSDFLSDFYFFEFHYGTIIFHHILYFREQKKTRTLHGTGNTNKPTVKVRFFWESPCLCMYESMLFIIYKFNRHKKYSVVKNKYTQYCYAKICYAMILTYSDTNYKKNFLIDIPKIVHQISTCKKFQCKLIYKLLFIWK